MIHQVSSSAVILSLFLGIAGEVMGADGPSDAESAKAFFVKGEELFEAESFLEAAAAFRRAYELAPHPSALCNIGYSYEYANEHAKAVTVYQEYLESAFEKDPYTVSDVRNRLTMLRLLVGELNIQCLPEDCTVEVDGVIKGKTSDGTLVVIMSPGKYSVTAKNDDNRMVTHEYRVEAGQKTNARFELNEDQEEETEQQEKVSTPVEDQSGPTGMAAPTIAFYGLAGGAVAGGVMISVFGGLTLKARNEYESSAYRDAGARDAAKRNKIITNAAIGVTAAFALGAAAVKFFEIRSRRKESSRAFTLDFNVGNVWGMRGRF